MLDLMIALYNFRRDHGHELSPEAKQELDNVINQAAEIAIRLEHSIILNTNKRP